ncbi:MAG: hypothetical protein CO128_07165 [Ignavibacteriales bacterium CG_4_9_14_3_um_filter_30_11]|nr:MAG: hypothetical protein CO128_07165 [Ignavibacteriales bacterium CG_4_9_14_3_um_filter_30_11]
MKNMKFLLFGLLFILTIITGCVNSVNSPNSVITTGPAGTITIYSPATNDSIGYKSNLINYLIVPTAGTQSVELYINGIFNSNYFPSVSTSQPLTLSFDPLQIGNRFSYYLKYYDKNGSFAFSDTMSNILITKVRVPPYAPINLALYKISPSLVNVSWKDSSSDVSFYEVWRKNGFSGTWNNLFGPLPPTTFNMNDASITPGIVYVYKVRSKNDFGYSQYSVSANPDGVGSSGLFEPPTNLVVTQVSSSPFSVKLNWVDNIPNENFFKIERNDNLSVFSEFQTIGTVAANVTTFVDDSFVLFSGRTYGYKIKAYSSSDSSWSNEYYITIN